MARLSTNDERRFREIAQNHQDLLTILFGGWLERFDLGELSIREHAKERGAVTKLRDTQSLIDAISVKGDAERERRQAPAIVRTTTFERADAPE